jgi:hypothetical protein
LPLRRWRTSYKGGTHFFVPTELIEKYSGLVVLRETLKDDHLARALEEMGASPAGLQG